MQTPRSPLRRNGVWIVWALGVGSLLGSGAQVGITRLSPVPQGARSSAGVALSPLDIRRFYQTLTDSPRRLVEAEARAHSGD